MEHIPRAQPCSHIYAARLLFMNMFLSYLYIYMHRGYTFNFAARERSVGSVDFAAIMCSDTFD